MKLIGSWAAVPVLTSSLRFSQLADLQLTLAQTEKNYFEAKLKLERLSGENQSLLQENKSQGAEKDELRLKLRQITQENVQIKERYTGDGRLAVLAPHLHQNWMWLSKILNLSQANIFQVFNRFLAPSFFLSTLTSSFVGKKASMFHFGNGVFRVTWRGPELTLDRMLVSRLSLTTSWNRSPMNWGQLVTLDFILKNTMALKCKPLQQFTKHNYKFKNTATLTKQKRYSRSQWGKPDTSLIGWFHFWVEPEIVLALAHLLIATAAQEYFESGQITK